MGGPAGEVPEPFQRLAITLIGTPRSHGHTTPRRKGPCSAKSAGCRKFTGPHIGDACSTAGAHEPPEGLARNRHQPPTHRKDADLDAALNLLRRLRPHLLRESDDVIFEDDDA
ncbi:hypothetical protein HPB47_022020 [Ixodes persulcatus]|uniref:Uncharacterized protein n=1 Tax=Ixodes persulcatus TaxID=34615 RepID=A0AC60QCR2_IXOPE|nr:hypothetical protein HPB47_022020 [Ixodes persulcatus]